MGAFSGIWIPLVTPFSHGAVDLERLQTLVKRYVQAGISGFVALADASTKPIVLYEIPYRTGVRLELDSLLTLAAHPRIQAIKDCSGSIHVTLGLIRDGRLQVLAGDDINLFTTLCLGGSGAIAASAHIELERFMAMYRAVTAGQLDDGR